MLLLAITNATLKKKNCKKNIIKFFYSSNSKMIFALWIEIVINYVFIIFISVRKTCFEKML